ncbi:MAG: 50S ribosomal protein L25 [Patulibacter sp.]
MATNSSSLAVASRAPQHSRDARRARRAGSVPAVLYGGDAEPVSISIDARELRQTLAAAGAVIDLSIDGGSAESVVVKDTQRHPVRGQIMHVDLLRVDLKQKIEATVPLELIDVEDAAGIKLGGILEHLLREVTVEALPTDIPESVTVSIKDLKVGHSLTVADAVVEGNYSIVDDAEATVVNLRAPRTSGKDDEEGDEGEESAESGE